MRPVVAPQRPHERHAGAVGRHHALRGRAAVRRIVKLDAVDVALVSAVAAVQPRNSRRGTQCGPAVLRQCRGRKRIGAAGAAGPDAGTPRGSLRRLTDEAEQRALAQRPFSHDGASAARRAENSGRLARAAVPEPQAPIVRARHDQARGRGVEARAVDIARRHVRQAAVGARHATQPVPGGRCARQVPHDGRAVARGRDEPLRNTAARHGTHLCARAANPPASSAITTSQRRTNWRMRLKLIPFPGNNR